MPRLSLYNPKKSNNYRYIDRLVKEQLYAGGTDLFIHKYLGTTGDPNSTDATQPVYDKMDPTNIQDLLFLENRNRKYDQDIYCIRGHYQVQNLDFDLSQFGLFLTNDIIFITVHYNQMIESLGRKVMVGDVIELPHLTDYHPLNETIPVGLRRYYQVTDGAYASEGYSATWYPHLWRIKCEPLVDSQEFSDILTKPTDTDNYLGEWNNSTAYSPGYTVSSGDKIYTPTQEVPAGTPLTDTAYWEVSAVDTFRELLSTYNRNLASNQAAIDEAVNNTPASGFDRSQLYLVATHDGVPMPTVNVVVRSGPPILASVSSGAPGTAYPTIQITAAALQSIWDMTADMDFSLCDHMGVSVEVAYIPPERNASGSGHVSGEIVLAVLATGPASGPVPPNDMASRRTTPENFGYVTGYMSGDGIAPNGIPAGSGDTFPSNPSLGDYFLRIDYLPQKLFRWDGSLWRQISENVRTGIGFDDANKSLRSSFINNSNVTVTTSGTTVPERQALSSILRIKPD